MKRLVVLGAAGDLAMRHLLPALAQLEAQGQLPDGFEVVAVAREDLDDDGYRRMADERMAELSGEAEERHRSALLARTRYVSGDVTEPQTLVAAIGDDEDEPLVAYLALPPSVFASAIDALHEAGLPAGSRVVVEKPFGEDLASAVELNRHLHRCLDEDQIFRIDHFLGLQTARNLLGLRFANRVFEPLWSAAHVERVEITWDETLALEGRAGYYDGAGALRDMIQNHLLQLMALVAMEPPWCLSARDLGDAKVALLRAVRTWSPEEAARNGRRARYGAGTVDGRDVPAYVEEEGVDPEADTETFAEVTLFVDSWRWHGVPFVLRSGKALGTARREIVVRFAPVPHLPFGTAGPARRNVMRFEIEPDRMALGVQIASDETDSLEFVELDRDLPAPTSSAYAHVLGDVLSGDAMLSIRDDEVEESWRIVEPFLVAWRRGDAPLEDYPAGSAGPER